jgi:hypothetical protein
MKKLQKPKSDQFYKRAAKVDVEYDKVDGPLDEGLSTSINRKTGMGQKR